MLQHFWASYPGRLIARSIARLFPTWFSERAWKFGEQEAIIRRELIEKAKSRASSTVLLAAIERSHNLLLTLFSEHFGGLALEEHIVSPSVHGFSQLYTIIMTLLCFRLRNRLGGLREDLVTICRESHLVETTWAMLDGLGENEVAQAQRIWDGCLQAIHLENLSQISFYRAFFVIIANRSAAELKAALS